MSDPIIMLDSAGNPLSVGMAVLWKGHGRREFRPGWVRDIILDGGKPAVRVDDGAEWDADLKGRTWSSTEWIDEPKRIRPRREQPKPDPRIAELTAEVERLRAERDRLARVLRVEQGDDSAGNPPRGWSHSLDLTDESGAVIRHVWTGALGEVYGSPYEGWWFTKVRGLYRENQPFHETALEAMEAADRAGGSNV